MRVQYVEHIGGQSYSVDFDAATPEEAAEDIKRFRAALLVGEGDTGTSPQPAN